MVLRLDAALDVSPRVHCKKIFLFIIRFFFQLGCREFFERVIVCNSLVWTCGVTGRPGLTYAEAIACEKKALAIIDRFPEHLRLVSARTAELFVVRPLSGSFVKLQH